MKVFLYSLLFILSLNTAVYAQSASEAFCESYMAQQEVQNNREVKHPKRISSYKIFNFVLRFIFAPHSLVELKPLNEEDLDEIYSSPVDRKILINFLKIETWTKDNKKNLKALKKEVDKAKREIKSLKVREVLERLTSFNECIAYVEQPEIIKALVDFDKILERHDDLSKKKTNYQTYKLIQKMAPSFKRKGWTYFEGLNINETHDVITQNKNSSILIIGHATPIGELVDDQLNVLPSTFFKNTAMSNLTIYSCYPEDVIGYYGIDSNENIGSYYYPKLTELTSNFVQEGQIPMNSFKKVLKTKMKYVSVDGPQDICEIQSNKENTDMGVFVNKTYVGGLKNSIEFDCSFLKEDNYIEVYKLVKESNVETLGLELIFNDNQIDLTEISSRIRNAHVVTRGNFGLTEIQPIYMY